MCFYMFIAASILLIFLRHQTCCFAQTVGHPEFEALFISTTEPRLFPRHYSRKGNTHLSGPSVSITVSCATLSAGVHLCFLCHTQINLWKGNLGLVRYILGQIHYMKGIKTTHTSELAGILLVQTVKNTYHCFFLTPHSGGAAVPQRVIVKLRTVAENYSESYLSFATNCESIKYES